MKHSVEHRRELSKGGHRAKKEIEAIDLLMSVERSFLQKETEKMTKMTDMSDPIFVDIQSYYVRDRVVKEIAVLRDGRVLQHYVIRLSSREITTADDDRKNK